jgi:hypothetical protein
MMKKLFLLISILLFLQCSTKTSKTIKPDVELFFKVYDDLMKFTASDSTGLGGSALLDSALQLHAMSKAKFDTTLAFLEKNPELFIRTLEAYEKKASPDSLQKIQ